MPDEKRKNRSQQSALLFVVLWALATLVSSYLLDTDLPARIVTSGSQLIVLLLLLGTPLITALQVLFTERIFKYSMRGYLIATLLGSLVTLLIRSQNWQIDLADLLMILQLAYFLPTMIFQSLWWRTRTKFVWLYPASATVSAYSVYQLSQFTVEDNLMRFLLRLVVGLVAGFVAHHLITHPKDSEKIRANTADETSIQQERVERLQEADETAQPWIEENRQQNRGTL